MGPSRKARPWPCRPRTIQHVPRSVPKRRLEVLTIAAMHIQAVTTPRGPRYSKAFTAGAASATKPPKTGADSSRRWQRALAALADALAGLRVRANPSREFE